MFLQKEQNYNKNRTQNNKDLAGESSEWGWRVTTRDGDYGAVFFSV